MKLTLNTDSAARKEIPVYSGFLQYFPAAVAGGTAFEIGLVFTVISLVRQYVLRRWFNGLKFGHDVKPAGG